MLGDERLELADEIAVVAKSELGIDPQLDGGQASLLESRALGSGEGLGELRQGGAAPEHEGEVEQPARLSGIAQRERLPGVGDRTLEAGEIEFVFGHLERIAEP